MNRIISITLWVLGWLFVPFIAAGIVVYKWASKKYDKNVACALMGATITLVLILWYILIPVAGDQDQLKGNLDSSPSEKIEAINVDTTTNVAIETATIKPTETEIKKVTAEKTKSNKKDTQDFIGKYYNEKNVRFELTKDDLYFYSCENEDFSWLYEIQSIKIKDDKCIINAHYCDDSGNFTITITGNTMRFKNDLTGTEDTYYKLSN